MKLAGVVLLVVLAAVGGLAVAWAQPQIAVEGRVQWIAGSTLVLALDDTPSVNVDLTQVHQDEYAGLVTGDRVMVTGTVADERDRVVATSVQRLPL